MSARRRPLRAGVALRRAIAAGAPPTALAAAQSAWPRAVGPAIAEQAEPVAEREGTVTVACRSAGWAQELDLMQESVLERLNEALSGDAGPSGEPVRVAALRFTADAARHTS